MMRMVAIFAALLAAGLLAGCGEVSADKAQPPVIEALYTAVPVNVDGKLDDPIWQKAKVYELQCPLDRLEKGETVHESGFVRYAWDDKYVYIAGKFTDSDLEANGKDDNMHHYQWGDLMEVFLWPEDHTWYWELYVTPLSKKTTFFFPAPGHVGMQNCFQYTCELTVAAQCQGTVNEWGDVDISWTAEMAVPVSELTKLGAKFGPGSNWRTLVGRYNYCVYIDRMGPELSSYPQLSKTNYHLRDEYARLLFVKE